MALFTFELLPILAITFTRTEPSLRARALAARELQDTSLLVEFTVAGASAAAIETAVAAVDSSTLAADITAELAALGIVVEVQGAVLSVVVEAEPTFEPVNGTNATGDEMLAQRRLGAWSRRALALAVTF